MYSNARNQDAFAKNISLSLAIIASAIILYAPFAIMAYQSKLQEIILLNLEFGQAQAWIKLSYAVTMIFTNGMALIPIFDISINARRDILA
jgi:hypothetical protein